MTVATLIPCAILPVSLLLAGSTVAQTLSADEKELAAYTLTMPTVKKMMAASVLLAEGEAKDPKVQALARLEAQIDALETKNELTEAQQAELDKLRERRAALEEAAENDPDSPLQNPKNLAEMEAAIKAHPAAMRAMTAAGITPREFTRASMALLQAAMIEGFSQGTADLKTLPAGINPENVKFVRAHKAELEAMQQALAARSKK